MKLKTLLFGIAISVLYASPVLADTIPTKPPVSITNGAYVCDGGFVKWSAGRSNEYLYINDAYRDSHHKSDSSYPVCIGPLHSGDSGTWTVRHINKNDSISNYYYTVTVGPHVMENGQCKYCGRGTAGPVTTPTSYSSVNGSLATYGSGNTKIGFWHIGDTASCGSVNGDCEWRYGSTVSFVNDTYDNVYDTAAKTFTSTVNRGVWSGQYIKRYSNGDWEANTYSGYYTVTPHEYVNGTCAVCGHLSHVHSYDTFVSYINTPTCTSGGTATYKCSCGNTTTKSVPALGHDYQWKWYALDGNANAYKQLTCSRCNALSGNRVYNTYNVTYITLDSDNNIELARETKTIQYGQTARGADLGKNNITVNGIEYAYNNETVVEVHSNCTIYRYMRKHSYTVRFDPNGGTGSMSNAKYYFNKEDHLPALGYSRIGYTWRGWSKTADGNIVYKDNQIVSDVMARTDNGADTTLYSIWKANDYTISFDTTPSQQTIASRTVTYDNTYGTLPTPATTGYTFLGWDYTTLSGDDYTHTPIDSTTVVRTPEDHTITATWDADKIKITFISPSKSEVITAVSGNSISAPFVPKETGMIFKHWSTSANGEAFDMNTEATTDLTLYAVFEPKRIVIDLTGVGEVDRDYNEELGDLPPWESPGKEFEDWYYDEELTQKVNPTDRTPSEGITLYPKYKDSIYTLALDTLPDKWEIKYGEMIPKLPVLTTEGKTFEYWEYNNKEVHSSQSYEWTTNVTLTPKWTTNSYQVLFPNGDVKVVNAGDVVGTLPSAPDRTGQTFVGYVDQFGETVDASTQVSKDMIISYKYARDSVTLTLVDEDWTSEISYEAGTLFTGLPERSRIGYAFKGWSLSKGGSTTNGPVYGDTALYAVYDTGMQKIYLADLNQTIERKTGSPLGNLPTVKKDGFEFDYWTCNGTEVTAYTTVPTGGMTLSAKFTPTVTDTTDTVEVRFWSDGVKINTIDLPRGEKLWDPGSPALNKIESRVFAYWSSSENGSQYIFSKRISVDTDLYACWN